MTIEERYEQRIIDLADSKFYNDESWEIICPCCGRTADFDYDNNRLICPHCGACNDEQYLIEQEREHNSFCDLLDDEKAQESDYQYESRFDRCE